MKRTQPLEINSAPAWTESFLNHSSSPGSETSGRTFQNTGVTTPAVNIIETREDFRLEMVAPGMKKEAFKVTLQSNVLTISYDHEDNREGERKDWKYRAREYNYHSFIRSFQLPDTLDTSTIDAEYVDGILHVRMPKKKHAIGRQIPVE